MTQEEIQQATENFNALSAEQKQAVWSKTIEELSNIKVSELNQSDQGNTEGGRTSVLDIVRDSINGVITIFC